MQGASQLYVAAWLSCHLVVSQQPAQRVAAVGGCFAERVGRFAQHQRARCERDAIPQAQHRHGVFGYEHG